MNDGSLSKARSEMNTETKPKKKNEEDDNYPLRSQPFGRE